MSGKASTGAATSSEVPVGSAVTRTVVGSMRTGSGAGCVPAPSRRGMIETSMLRTRRACAPDPVGLKRSRTACNARKALMLTSG